MGSQTKNGKSTSHPWTIGIYAGEHPYRLRPHPHVTNPIIDCDALGDPGAFVADPFVMRTGNVSWTLFFELMRSDSENAEIAFASSDDGLHWQFGGTALHTGFHLSYPYVFESDGQFYMIPETIALDSVNLYRAVDFPHRWEHVSALLPRRMADPSILRHGDHWWLFGCPEPYTHDALALWFAEELRGPWVEHPASPLIEGDTRNSRPAGRVIKVDGRPVRFAQECEPIYGSRVNAFEIVELSESSYREEPCPRNPILEPTVSGSWNSNCMHHVDPIQLEDGTWLAFVDGR